MVTVICCVCGLPFESERRTRKYHTGDCACVMKARAQARYQTSPKGVGAMHAASARYEKTEKAVLRRKRVRRGIRSHITRALQQQRWRFLHPDLVRRSRYLIHTLQKPCSICGETDKAILECDHILARCLGGTDELSNLQVLCIKHHKEKTMKDVQKYKATKQALSLVGG